MGPPAPSTAWLALTGGAMALHSMELQMLITELPIIETARNMPRWTHGPKLPSLALQRRSAAALLCAAAPVAPCVHLAPAARPSVFSSK